MMEMPMLMVSLPMLLLRQWHQWEREEKEE